MSNWKNAEVRRERNIGDTGLNSGKHRHHLRWKPKEGERRNDEGTRISRRQDKTANPRRVFSGDHKKTNLLLEATEEFFGMLERVAAHMEKLKTNCRSL